jgi:hypothetical protein|tara:strand:+ start:427 stop:687 length:261 start_codon:yes stop_codon:yes gene_type:complete
MSQEHIKSKRIATGLYQATYRGHVVTIANVRDEVEWEGPGTLFWSVQSDTLDLDSRGDDTLFINKFDAMCWFPNIVDNVLDGTSLV